MIRCGFAVRVVGQPALRSHDSRRNGQAHLSVSLVYLRDILRYLQHIGVRYYRVANRLLPLPRGEAPLHAAQRQIHECHTLLETIAEEVQARGIRLTMHAGYHLAPGQADTSAAASTLCDELEAHALLLEALDPCSVLVVHSGGKGRAALERFARRFTQLSPRAQARLVVEHEPAGHSLDDLLWLHQHCGIPLVFDYLHHRLAADSTHVPLELALGLALATWPPHMRAEVHLSSMRSEAHLLPAHNGQAARVVPPRAGQHADFITAPDTLALLRAARGLPAFDLMLEAKAGDLALLRMRDDATRLAPELAACLA